MIKVTGRAALEAAKALGLTSVLHDGVSVSIGEAKEIVQDDPADVSLWLSDEQRRRLSATT